MLGRGVEMGDGRCSVGSEKSGFLLWFCGFVFVLFVVCG